MSVYALPLNSSGIAPGGESRGHFLMSDLYLLMLDFIIRREYTTLCSAALNCHNARSNGFLWALLFL